MPEVDVTSFECRDEQEFLSDEAYVIINSDSGAQRISDTYTGLDTGDDINLHLKSNFNRSAGIQIWEDDGPKGVSPEDDFIGGLRAFRDDTGTHTVTLQGSGGEYDLTYFVA